jgi:hypothetical protein
MPTRSYNKTQTFQKVYFLIIKLSLTLALRHVDSLHTTFQKSFIYY